METIEVYSASELKEKFPEGFEYAHEKWQNSHSHDTFRTDEIMDSLKGIFKASGIKLDDWSISDSSESYVKFTLPTYWSELADCDQLVDDYTGRRALNWTKTGLELKSVKRIGYPGKNKQKLFRYDVIKSDGKPWSCEFTGVCYDHDFLDSLLDDIKSGCTLSEAYHNLADKAGRLFYEEWKDQMSEEYFIDFADANEFKFTEEGKQI